MTKFSFTAPKSKIFKHLTKALMATGMWFILFSLIFINIKVSFSELTESNFLHLWGSGFLLALLFIAGWVCLSFFERRVFLENKNLLLIWVTFCLTAAVFETCIAVPLNLYLLPIPGIAILLALLLSPRASFIVTLTFSLLFGLIAQGRADLFLTMFLGSSLGIILNTNTRKRNQLLNAGILIGILNFFVITLLGLYEGQHFQAVLKDALWGFGGGVFTSFFVMGLLHIFEIGFNITTNITLLELSDLNNPLLKELILKAPGTYHHSLVVGNLAEAACDSISANSLLARVGAYYHDIGKIEKPEYFSENEHESKSRHTQLTPTMSALVIIKHVRDGLELAKKHKLPASLINFIQQHHGTGLIYFFYQRALEKVKDESHLKEEGFRYPGPKPQTKETAVILLADSVEASSRCLSDPTPAKIEALTQKIINNKFIDGQLDECELSLKDLNKIATSFARILTGMFHSRISYPEVSNSST